MGKEICLWVDFAYFMYGFSELEMSGEMQVGSAQEA